MKNKGIKKVKVSKIFRESFFIQEKFRIFVLLKRYSINLTKYKTMKNLSKKSLVLDELYLTFGMKEFDTDDIKIISKKHSFKNQFDVAKLDSKDQLSPLMIKNDVFLLKVGNGKYKFFNGINSYYHDLEKITNIVEMNYIPDEIIGDITSEGDILKYIEINNILADFLNEDVQSYGAGRRSTKELNYYIGKEEINLKSDNVQIEIDESYFAKKMNTLFSTEAKNKHLKSFNVSQLFFPCFYFSKVKGLSSKKNIKGLFIQNKLVRNKYYEIQIYEYEFTNDLDITSISLIKNKSYKLIF